MSQQVAIKPFINKNDNGNMGLTKQGLAIADGCIHAQVLRCLDSGNGVKTYITGLNEGAKEVQSIENEKEKNARIYDIRKTVVYLENHLAGNYNISESDIYVKVQLDDKKGPGGRPVENIVEKFNPDFWSKVTKFKSVIVDEFDNSSERNRIPTFWDSVELKCGNHPVVLDTTEPYNIMLLRAIDAGGFGDILAPSLEAANNMMKPPKFYLDKIEETAALDTSVSKIRNKAGGLLDNLFDNAKDKLFYIVKNLGTFSLGYRKSTPADILYKDVNSHLEGLGVEKNKKLAAEQFLELEKLSMSTLKMRAMVKDASNMNIIGPKGDGQIYYHKKSIPMGKTVEDVTMWLNNDMNNAEMQEILEVIEKEWNK